MPSFTFSLEQILVAPLRVREWMEQETAAAPIVIRGQPDREQPAEQTAAQGLQVFVVMPNDLAAALDEIVAWWREQRIRERAYAIWEQAGRPEGKAAEHWLQAEAAVRRASPLETGQFRYLARRMP